ncbi:hypothetical protein Tco_0127779, partial [Tanacetum coccineum]
MPKPRSPLQEPSQENPPTTHSNHDLLKSHSPLLGDSCDTNVGQALIPQSANQTQLTQPSFPHLLINPHMASVLHAQTPPSPQGDNQTQPPLDPSPSREMLIDDINQLQDLSNLLAMHLSQRNTPSSPYSSNLPHTLNLNQVEQNVTDKSKRGFGYTAVPSPHPLILNRPTPLDLSYSGLEEFQQPEVNGYGPRDSSLKPTTVCDRESNNSKENTDDSLTQQPKTVTETSSVVSPFKVDKDWKEKFFHPANHVRVEEPKKARNNTDAPIIEDWVSDDEEEVESIPKEEKKADVPTATKKESVTDKSKRGFGYTAVPSPHPLILNRPTPLDLSYSGLEEFKQPEVHGYGPRDSSLKPTTVCDRESNNSKENTDDSLTQQPKTVTETSSVVSPFKADKEWKEKFFHPANNVRIEEPKKARDNSDAPIIEDWVSDDEEEVETIPKEEKKTNVPTATEKESVKTVKPSRRSIRYAEMYRSQRPRGNQRNWNGQKLGCNFVFNNKACFICGNFDHIQYNCPNAYKHVVPRAVLMKTGLNTVKNAKPLSTVRSINTARPFSTARARGFNAVKPSACWVWRPIKPNGAL